jgi:hypothetical protein
MTEKEYIFELMYRAFLDIRIASYSQDSHTCFVLSDVFHNVPSQMNLADKGEMRYADIVTRIQEKCQARNCTSWLDNAIVDIAHKAQIRSQQPESRGSATEEDQSR